MRSIIVLSGLKAGCYILSVRDIVGRIWLDKILLTSNEY